MCIRNFSEGTRPANVAAVGSGYKRGNRCASCLRKALPPEGRTMSVIDSMTTPAPTPE